MDEKIEKNEAVDRVLCRKPIMLETVRESTYTKIIGTEVNPTNEG